MTYNSFVKFIGMDHVISESHYKFKGAISLITPCLGSIGMDCVLSHSNYKETISQRN